VNQAANDIAASPLLAVNNIEVIYDHVILVLKGVSLEVPEQGIVALLGPPPTLLPARCWR
jgi:branched-chain amino acid transport system ATP-binding protein